MWLVPSIRNPAGAEPNSRNLATIGSARPAAMKSEAPSEAIMNLLEHVPKPSTRSIEIACFDQRADNLGGYGFSNGLEMRLNILSHEQYRSNIVACEA
jgi:hypothetical protein